MRDLWVSSYKVGQSLRLSLLKHLRSLPSDFHQNRGKGDSLAALTDDIAMIEVMLSEALPRLIQALVLPLLVILWLAIVDLRLGGVVTVSIILAIPFLLWANQRLQSLSVRRQDLQATAGGEMVEYVLGLPVIRTFSRLKEGKERFARSVDSFRDISICMAHQLTLPIVGYGAILLLGPPLTMGDLAWRSGSVQPTVLISALLMLFSVYLPVLSLVGVVELLRMAEASLARVSKIFDAQPLQEPQHPASPQGNTISMKAVSFAYEGAPLLLKDLSFTIQSGSVTALIGPSGCGKSTALSLLMRIRDPDSGTIRIGGEDLRHLSRYELHRLVHLEPQESPLLSGSIADNISLLRPGASQSEIVEAAKAAQAHGFITKQPWGYQTVLGEGGATLSGGERQRICIARGLLSPAEILLFDEVTSAIDPTTEREILNSLKQVAKGRSLVFATHRDAVRDGADQVIEFSKLT